MTAWYNEIDGYAAEWLRNLIAAGHIAPGVVDTRSISEIEPDDLRDFTQCHFFAGIGVWSHALRLAGWPDERPVWTGSCPCQPFSSAGRSGGFSDERHLWPHFHHLIRERRPVVVFGEQVASKDGLAWLDLVLADLEGEDYAAAALDLCAAGVGAPHIRQRLYWVADADCGKRDGLSDGEGCQRDWTPTRRKQSDGKPECGESVSGMDHHHEGLEGFRSGHQTPSGWQEPTGSASATSEPCRMADYERVGRERRPHAGQPSGEGKTERIKGARHLECGCVDGAASPTNGHWRAADWLQCRDGKWRPVEPGTFPLAHGAAARVGRLRAYGNAIVAQVAAEFVSAFMECRP